MAMASAGDSNSGLPVVVQQVLLPSQPSPDQGLRLSHPFLLLILTDSEL